MSACQTHPGYIGADGYGRINPGGGNSPRLAHRVAYERARGPIPEGMVIMHLCHNRACVNADHLEAGTQQQNIQMSAANMAREPMPGESNPAAKLTEDDVREIRRLYIDGLAQTAIAARFGVRQTNISMIVNRKTWSHVQ